MASLTSATVLVPTDLLPFMDKNRVYELLVDEGDTAVTIDDIDEHATALLLARAAWSKMIGACRRGDIYEGRELVDLANDTERGQALVSLVADLFWCSLQRRRRYTEGEPQAKDAACEEAEKQLENLQSGHRIFVLDGVSISDSNGDLTGGTYTNVKGEPTRLTTGSMGDDGDTTDPLNRLWRCTKPDQYGRYGGGWD